uniref:Trigger factor n=1 Tax=Lygus hesperus TaxID=30085 RepID=A0A0A9WRA6_LYGHE
MESSESSGSSPLILYETKSFTFRKPSLGEHIKFTPKLKTGPEDLNIFQAKTPEEIQKIYNKLLVTVGRWSAEMYLKIRAKLAEDSVTVPPVCPEFLESFSGRKCMFDTVEKPRELDPNTNKYVLRECKPKKVIESSPAFDESDFGKEPSYKNIFKNARNNRKSSEDKREEIVLLKEISNAEDSQLTDSLTNSLLRESSSSSKPSGLMPDGNNNYLLEIRERRRLSKKMTSQDQVKLEVELDDIAATFQSVPIRHVLHHNLDEQVDLTKAIIGERLTKVDPEDEMKGLSYMKRAMLGNEDRIEDFQEKFNDERWRRKFDLDKIEQSDEEDTTDGSKIYISDSSSLCSQDSFGSSIDGKNRHPKLSRIPYVEEVHRRKDSYFDKISKKWEKVVTKNLIEPNLKLTPIFRCLYTDVRLRSADKFYQRILESLDAKYEEVYPKKFVPYKHRLRDWTKKDAEMAANAGQVHCKRRLFESANLVKKRPQEEPKLIDYTPTKHLINNQRIRLKCIMKDIENREKLGMTDWRKQAFVEEYVNLRPIIATKRKDKTRRMSTRKKRNISRDISSKAKLMVHFPQIVGTDSSTYFIHRAPQDALPATKKYFPMGV